VNKWDASAIFDVLDAPRAHEFYSDITVLQIDENLKIVLGYTADGSVFFGCVQVGEISGFIRGRARLEVLQTIDLKHRGVIEPALVLSFLVNSEEELSAISTIFSGLYDLNKNSPGTINASVAAQGFEEYFAELPKIGMSNEIEIGLFGELALISASSKMEELVRAWHASPSSTYDFTFNGKQLEVKTSTRPTRLVWLRSSQSVRDSDTNLTYLSIYTPIDVGGITVGDLVTKIRNCLSPLLKRLFDEKLSRYNIEICQKSFDLNLALQSFRFISSVDIPIPTNIDPRILELRWKCSFKTLPINGDPNLWI
jgi:hypothetical protein